MLATSKNVIFPGHKYLLTTSTDDPTLWLLPERQQVKGHWYRWLACQNFRNLTLLKTLPGKTLYNANEIYSGIANDRMITVELDPPLKTLNKNIRFWSNVPYSSKSVIHLVFRWLPSCVSCSLMVDHSKTCTISLQESGQHSDGSGYLNVYI